MRIFCMNTIACREPNLVHIIPNVVEQADILYINLIGYDHVPDVLVNHNVIVRRFDSLGSEGRFLYYNDINPNDYYFPIDDDIVYPKDYAEKLIYEIQRRDNKVVSCVHGSIQDMQYAKTEFFKTGLKIKRFSSRLNNDLRITIPGVGTSCFYKGTGFKISMDDFIASNITDVHVACFLEEQQIPVYAIKRDCNWLQELPKHCREIWSEPKPRNKINYLVERAFRL